MKLDPNPRPWDDDALRGPAEAAQVVPEPQLQISDDEDPVQNDENIPPEELENNYYLGSDSDDEEVAGYNEVQGIPFGQLVERFTFEVDCMTCDNVVELPFVASNEAAAVFGTLMETRRLNPLCRDCVTWFRQQGRQQRQEAPPNGPAAQQPAAAAAAPLTPPPEDENGGQ